MAELLRLRLTFAPTATPASTGPTGPMTPTGVPTTMNPTGSARTSGDDISPSSFDDDES